MARHWSAFVPGITERQAMALDKMAEAHDVGDGMDLLMRISGYSRSKVGKCDRGRLRPYIDEAFSRYGRESS